MLNKTAPAILILLALALAACGTIATPVWEKPEPTATEAQSAAVLPTTAHAAASVTPTLVPPTATLVPATATFTAEPPTPTLVPPTATTQAQPSNDPIAFFVSQSNPEHGKQLFETFYEQAGYACATCHRIDSEDRLIGPGLLNIGTRAGQHAMHMAGMPEESIERYLYNSIVDPSAYVVPEYPDNLMPKVWGQVFSEQDIYDLIAYLLTLK